VDGLGRDTIGGMTSSYNGWTASRTKSAIGVDSHARARGTAVEFPGGVKAGDVATVLMYLAGEFHRRVEPLAQAGCWGYNYRPNRNANNLSCHASATAIDCNAPRHPNGKRGTFRPAQVKAIRAILAECSGVVRWGGDFHGTPDEMHFEINANAAAVHKAALHIEALTHKPVPAPPKPAVRKIPAWWTRPFQTGSTDVAAVKAVQTRLRVAPVDGDFGRMTMRAVVAFKKAHGLPGNDVVDAETAKLLG
jgi:peptidoglycan hydrolase-like protein with peptidoglycan-binding domain